MEKYLISAASGRVHLHDCARVLGRQALEWDPNKPTDRYAAVGACVACLPGGLPERTDPPGVPVAAKPTAYGTLAALRAEAGLSLKFGDLRVSENEPEVAWWDGARWVTLDVRMD